MTTLGCILKGCKYAILIPLFICGSFAFIEASTKKETEMNIIGKLAIEAYNFMFFTREPNTIQGYALTANLNIDVTNVGPNIAKRFGSKYLQKMTFNCTDIFTLTCLEQNPFKNSTYGLKARAGARIMWIIAKNNATKKEKWIGRVENGTWYPK